MPRIASEALQLIREQGIFPVESSLPPEARNPRVYISGPISKPTKKKGRYGKNIVPAMNMWAWLWSAGFTPYCPHLSYQLSNHLTKEWGYELTHEEWMEQDLQWLALCDAMIRLPGESPGADMEEAYCKAHDIPVFTDIEQMQRYFDFAEKNGPL